MRTFTFLLLTLLCAALWSCGKPAISGTVTFYADEIQDFLPDSGAVVYATRLPAETIEKFVGAATYKYNIESYQKQVKMYEHGIERCLKAQENASPADTAALSAQIANYQGGVAECTGVILQMQQGLYSLVQGDDEYEQWEKAAVNTLVEIKGDPATVSATADGNGDYILALPKGDYYLIFVSKNTSKLNLLEKQGAVRAKKITLPDYTSLNVGFNPLLPLE